MFYDLNIVIANPKSCDGLEEIVSRLLKYGYKNIALTTHLQESELDKPKQQKDEKKNCSAMKPRNSIPFPLDLSSLKSKYPNVRFFSRIHFKVSECANVRKFFQFKETIKYDLISLEPLNQDVLKSLANISGLDIISYNPESKCNLSISRKLYKQLINQNIYFELIYGPGIVDSSARRNLFMISQNYNAAGKCKNVIVSSGAEAVFQIRSPYDVINFNTLFGLSRQQSKEAITENCKKLILRASLRKNCKAHMDMVVQKEANT